MRNFVDKTVVITGAASGMGRAYADAFAKRGARLALIDVDTLGLEETVAVLGPEAAERVMTMTGDVADAETMAAFAERSRDELGDAHVLVNNAGVAPSGRPAGEVTLASFQRVMNINFYGVVHGVQAFMPQLARQPWAAIVNISSIFGLVGAPRHAEYCAAKFAVRGYTETLLSDLADSAIQVHLVHPGGVDTRIARDEHMQAFAKRYLSTPPADIARHVIRAIEKNKPRVVCGHDSFKTAVGARLLPLGLMSRLIRRDMQGLFSD